MINSTPTSRRAGLRKLVLAFLAPLMMLTFSAPVAHADDRQVIDDYLADVLDAGVPGIAVAVLRDGKLITTAAAGEAESGRPMTTATPMRIESLSKSFTALTVMQLVEQGEVDLDQPVRHYLPEFTSDDPRVDRITIRHLLSQTSGMADATGPDLYARGTDTLQEAVAHLRTAHLAADPGSSSHYHNPNYHVLARMVEVVSDQPFADYLDDHVFGPLGMSNTADTRLATDVVPGQAAGHLIVYGRAVPTAGQRYFSEGSGGIVSTADDMARWLELQAGAEPSGSRPVIGKESRDLMHTPASAVSNAYGYGWYQAESAEGPPVRISHSGAGAGFGAYQGIFPESGYAIAVMINSGASLTSPDPGVVAQNLLHHLEGDIPSLQPFASGTRTDLILTALAMITVGLTVVGLIRAPRWGRHRAGRSRIGTVLRLLPALVPVVWLLALPSLQLLATGRSAPYPLLFHVSPVAMSWFAVWALVCAALILVRIGCYVRSERSGSASTTAKEGV